MKPTPSSGDEELGIKPRKESLTKPEHDPLTIDNQTGFCAIVR
jgi:hypothetical protein